MTRTLFFCCAASFLAGCTSSNSLSSSSPARVASATPQQNAALIDQVKQLAGTWEILSDKGEVEGTSTFAVSSGGSVVREIMFVGAEQEMTNVYHMDGPTLVMTHYCAAGNQPRLRAAAGKPGTIEFKTDSVTNWTGGSKEYMGELTLTIRDKDHISQSWTSFAEGKRQPTMVMQLRRKG